VENTIKLGDQPLEGTNKTNLLTSGSPDAYNDIEHPERVAPKEVELTVKKGIVRLPP